MIRRVHVMRISKLFFFFFFLQIIKDFYINKISLTRIKSKRWLFIGCLYDLFFMEALFQLISKIVISLNIVGIFVINKSSFANQYLHSEIDMSYERISGEKWFYVISMKTIQPLVSWPEWRMSVFPNCNLSFRISLPEAYTDRHWR